jgi:hypothetical protein
MPQSVDHLALYRAQADEMIAVAAKTPLPAIYVTLFDAMAVAHAVRAKALRNTSLDGVSQPTGRRPARSAN